MSKTLSTLLFVGILTLGGACAEAAHAEDIDSAYAGSESSQVAGGLEEGGLGDGEAVPTKDEPSTAGGGVTEGVTASPEEVRNQAVYDKALKSIENLNKAEALNAAIGAVDAQVKDFATWVDIPFGINQVEGNTIGGLFGATTPWDFVGGGAGSIKVGLYCELNNIESCSPSTTVTDSFKTLIDRAMADSRYTTDAEFKAMVDDDAKVYNYGRTILEQTIPKLGSSYTEYTLKSKTDAELVKIARELPETVAYMAPFSLEVFEHSTNEWSLYRAYYDARSSLAAETPEDVEAKYYALLVTAATRVNPEFRVDLSGVTSLVKTETTTKAPNSGSLFAEGVSSATMVTVALGAVAGVAGIAGLVYTVKRYLFSPLKRRH